MTTLALTLMISLFRQGALEDQVRRLGADEPDVRDRAVEEILRAGPEILARMRELQKSIKDREVVARIIHIIGELERLERLKEFRTGPKRVTLHLNKASLQSAFKTLSEQSSFPIEVGEGLEGLVTARVNDAPFWEALDSLCRAAGNVTSRMEKKEGRMRVVIVEKPEREPTHVSVGAYRIQLSRVYVGYPKPFSADKDANTSLYFRVNSEPDDHPAGLIVRLESITDEHGTDYSGWIKRVAARRSPIYRPRRYTVTGRTYLTGGIRRDATRLNLKGTITALFPRDVRRSRVEDLSKDLPKASVGDWIRFRIEGVTSSGSQCTVRYTITGMPDGSELEDPTSLLRESANFQIITRDGVRHWRTSGSSRGSGVGRTGQVSFPDVRIADVKAIELVYYDGIEEVVLPFELKDVPLD